MKIRELEAALQRVRPFDTKLQKIDLEQFPTGWHIASRLVHTAAVGYGDVEGKTVVDLGTGTAMLGIGCALLGAGCVLGLDADVSGIA
jgi:putative methylase